MMSMQSVLIYLGVSTAPVTMVSLGLELLASTVSLFKFHFGAMSIDYCIAGQYPCSKGCVSNAMCVYSDRGYRCLCDHGFTGDGMLGGSGCSALANGCSTSSPCAYGATCSISNGTYSCHCGPGFSGDGYSSCTSM